MGIYYCWRMPIVFLGRGTHIYFIAATKLWSPILVHIRYIIILILGIEGSQDFGPTLKSFISYCKGPHNFNFSLEVLIFQCGGIIFTYSFSFSVMMNIFIYLLMFQRMQLRHWDPGISWNDRFPKVSGTFGSLQRRQWDLGILLSYFKWVGNFAKGSGIRKMAMIRVVQQKHGGQICSTLWCFCLRTSRFGRGGLSCPLKVAIKVLTILDS